MRIRSYLLLTACLLLAGGLAGCGRSGSAVYCEPVDPCGWQPGDTLRIVHHNTDTVGRYDIKLFASWAARPAALHRDTATVRLIVRTPDSLRCTELVRLQDDRAGNRAQEWQTSYRTGVRFAQYGDYEFAFVRETGEPPIGLRALGVEITQTKHGKR